MLHSRSGETYRVLTISSLAKKTTRVLFRVGISANLNIYLI
jgi:hypothetical protein